MDSIISPMLTGVAPLGSFRCIYFEYFKLRQLGRVMRHLMKATESPSEPP